MLLLQPPSSPVLAAQQSKGFDIFLDARIRDPSESSAKQLPHPPRTRLSRCTCYPKLRLDLTEASHVSIPAQKCRSGARHRRLSS